VNLLLTDEEILGMTVDEKARELTVAAGYIGFTKYPGNINNKDDVIWHGDYHKRLREK